MNLRYLAVLAALVCACGSSDVKKMAPTPIEIDSVSTDDVITDGPSDDPVATNNVNPTPTPTPNPTPDPDPTPDPTPDPDPVVNELPVHVQLVWDTAQTDLDIHVAHAAAGADSRQPDLDEDGLPDPWLHEFYDCSWRNKAPDWGAAGLLNDPAEDIDDTAGLGPENINIETPEGDVEYRVGVRYYSDPAAEGPTRATVRIYIGGELLAEFSQVLNSAKDMWEVATISGDGVVTEVSRGGLPKVTPSYSPESVFP